MNARARLYAAVVLALLTARTAAADEAAPPASPNSLPSLPELSRMSDMHIERIDKEIAQKEARVSELRAPISDRVPIEYAESAGTMAKATAEHAGDAISPGIEALARATDAALGELGELKAQEGLKERFSDYLVSDHKEEERLGTEIRQLKELRAKLVWLNGVIAEAQEHDAAKLKATSSPSRGPTASSPAVPSGKITESRSSGEGHSHDTGQDRAGSSVGDRSGRSEGGGAAGPKTDGPRNDGPRNDGPKNGGDKDGGEIRLD